MGYENIIKRLELQIKHEEEKIIEINEYTEINKQYTLGFINGMKLAIFIVEDEVSFQKYMEEKNKRLLSAHRAK